MTAEVIKFPSPKSSGLVAAEPFEAGDFVLLRVRHEEGLSDLWMLYPVLFVDERGVPTVVQGVTGERRFVADLHCPGGPPPEAPVVARRRLLGDAEYVRTQLCWDVSSDPAAVCDVLRRLRK